MLTALAAALAARDPSTAAHCTRVTLLAARVAVWMGWDDDRLRTLALGGPLHDIGKVDDLGERSSTSAVPSSPTRSQRSGSIPPRARG